MWRFLPKFPKLVLSSILLICFGFIINTKPTFAVDSNFGFAVYAPIRDTDVQDGSLVSTSPDGIYLSKSTYDAQLSGVVTLKSAITVGLKKAGSYPINTKGAVNVRVSTTNGKITKGDFVTSSSIPGVAMKATKTGMILGTALDDYAEEDKNKIGTIQTYIDIRMNQSDVYSRDEQYALKKDIAPWRIALGGTIAIGSTLACFFLFGRYTSKVVDAMARNPLASKNLKRNMFLQGVFLLLFIATGYFITYILIKG